MRFAAQVMLGVVLVVAALMLGHVHLSLRCGLFFLGGCLLLQVGNLNCWPKKRSVGYFEGCKDLRCKVRLLRVGVDDLFALTFRTDDEANGIDAEDVRTAKEDVEAAMVHIAKSCKRLSNGIQ